MKRVLATMSVVLLVASPSLPAAASDAVAMNVLVQLSEIVSPEPHSGDCDFSVTSRVTVINLLDDPVTVSGVAGNVDFEESDSAGSGHLGAVIVDDGPDDLSPPFILAAGEKKIFDNVVTEFSIPCDALYAQIEFRLTSDRGVDAGDAPILEGGVPTPLVTLAGIGVSTALIAGVFGIVQRRRSRQPAL